MEIIWSIFIPWFWMARILPVSKSAILFLSFTSFLSMAFTFFDFLSPHFIWGKFPISQYPVVFVFYFFFAPLWMKSLRNTDRSKNTDCLIGLKKLTWWKSAQLFRLNRLFLLAAGFCYCSKTEVDSFFFSLLLQVCSF